MLPLQIETLEQIALTITDPAASLAFYRDILGLKLLFSAGDLHFFDCGNGTRLMLSKGDHPSEQLLRGTLLYFRVPNLESAHADLKAAGVKNLDEPHFIAPMPTYDLWMSFYHDPDGNPFALTAHKPR